MHQDIWRDFVPPQTPRCPCCFPQAAPSCPEVVALPYFPCSLTHTHTHTSPTLSPKHRPSIGRCTQREIRGGGWKTVAPHVRACWHLPRARKGEGTGRRRRRRGPTQRPVVINTVFTPWVPASLVPLICPVDDLPSLMWNEAWSRVVHHRSWWERPRGRQPIGRFSGPAANDWASAGTRKG